MKYNKRFYNSLYRISQETPPIWLMRQAGRYHSHYQALRKDHDFMTLCKSPELAARAALGPVEDFDFDLAILFSDLLFPLEGLGLGLSYQPEPRIQRLLSKDTLKQTKPVQEIICFLDFQGEALAETRRLLADDKGLVGFVGGLWTLFTYAVEGTHSGNLAKAKQHLLGRAPLFTGFCEKMLPVLKHNISMQLEKGAEIVFIFDTAAGQLSGSLYRQWIAPTLGELALEFPYKLAYFAKGVSDSIYDLDCFAQRPWGGFVYDHRWFLPNVLEVKDLAKRPRQTAIQQRLPFCQGNFDPALMLLPEDELRRELDNFLEPIQELSLRDRAGWICSLGHGVLPTTPENNVRCFVNHVRTAFGTA